MIHCTERWTAGETWAYKDTATKIYHLGWKCGLGIAALLLCYTHAVISDYIRFVGTAVKPVVIISLCWGGYIS